RKIGRGGFIGMFLLVLLLLGAGSHIGAEVLGIRLPIPGIGKSNVQPQITTTPINTMVTYAGVDVTVLTAQQAESFVDDPNTATTGMVRLYMREQNKTSVQMRWSYYDVARLVLPGKKVVAPTFVQAKVGIAPGTTQQSKIDFAVPTGTRINQLTLR